MSGQNVDIAIAGGGLSGGLTALALYQAHPDMRIRLLESAQMLGGNHRWSWFASDLDDAATSLLAPFHKSEWNAGYDVLFPAHSRHLRTPYRSLASADFNIGLHRELPHSAIRTHCHVAALDARGVTLSSGERIEARIVIDCRNWDRAHHFHGGWQLFMGRHMRTARPHQIDRPVIMDATVEQHGAYRFIYVLPLSADELFIEDTYYADSPVLDRDALSGRIDRYASTQGWDGEILGEETGVLPVITGGNFSAYQDATRIPGVAIAGSRGGFVHPLTSYSLPWAVDTALAIARNALLPGEQLAAMLEERARSHWNRTGFYRMLGTMLFAAAKPDLRYRVFERFYRLPEGLVERFYAARSTMGDRLRVLSGRPPVPVHRAIGALISGAAPLANETRPLSVH